MDNKCLVQQSIYMRKYFVIFFLQCICVSVCACGCLSYLSYHDVAPNSALESTSSFSSTPGDVAVSQSALVVCIDSSSTSDSVILLEFAQLLIDSSEPLFDSFVCNKSEEVAIILYLFVIIITLL